MTYEQCNPTPVSFRRLIRPAVINEVHSPQSYVAEFADGSRRIFPANNWCKFHTRAQILTYNVLLATCMW